MLRTTFLDDIDSLDYLRIFPNNIKLVRTFDQSKYYLLDDHFAMEVDKGLFNEDYDFIDPAAAQVHFENFAHLYNPFKPHLYTKCEGDFEIIELDELKIHSVKLNAELYYRDNEQYVIHKNWPWIGMNISYPYGLRCRIAGELKSEKNNSAFEIAFLKDWQTHLEQSRVSNELQQLIRCRFAPILEKSEEVKKKKQSAQAIRLNEIKEKKIRSLLNDMLFRIYLSLEIQSFAGYLDSLGELRRDRLAQDKYKTFGGFIREFLEIQNNVLNRNRAVEIESFFEWLNKLNDFNHHFAGHFTPRPGLFKAKNEESTKCYQLMNQLKTGVERQIANNPAFREILPKPTPTPGR